jgi:two-component system, LytTR family, response regulator
MILSCIAIDDEPLAIEKLKMFLSKIKDVNLLKTFSNCVDALPYISSNNPDVLFLDIEISSMSGIELLESVTITSHIVIISAYEQYALKGYELDVTDYILKPYNLARLIKSLDKIRNIISEQKQIKKNKSNNIFIKTDYKIVKINIDDILYIEGMRDYLCLHTKQGKVLTLITFADLLFQISSHKFIRIHKSFVVNVDYIKSIEKNRVYINDKILKIGETYKDNFYKELKIE